MSAFLLELLSEEIPARMQEKACADLARLFAAEIAKTRAERLEYIHHVEKLIQKEMLDNGVPCEVMGRAKHLWSIYSKMKRTQRPFDEIHDAIGFRVPVVSNPKRPAKRVGGLAQSNRPADVPVARARAVRRPRCSA